MPMNTNTVTSMVALTWSNRPCVRSPPQKLARNRSTLNAKITMHDENHDRDDLGDRDDHVDGRCLLDAAQDQEVEQPNPDRGDDDRDRRVAIAEHGKNAPIVDLISTQYDTLPMQLPIQ